MWAEAWEEEERICENTIVEVRVLSILIIVCITFVEQGYRGR
jgi:hypothetical protein